jgi:signal transduction histidine kinase
MSLQDDADLLARELFETKSKLRASGRALHDHVGPLLSAAGIRLGLLRTDHPQAAPEIEQALLALEEAMERVRTLSRELNPPPAAHLGLKRTLGSLIEKYAESFPGRVRLSYTASVALPDDAALAIYEAAAAVLARAVADRSAREIAISVTGVRNLLVRIQSDGRGLWPASMLSALNRRAGPAGIVLDATTKRVTIVSIRYAPGRSAGG